MRQKHVEFGSSCLRKNIKKVSHYKLFAACMLLSMSLSTALHADTTFVTVGTDSLQFFTSIWVLDHDQCGPMVRTYTKSWNPYSSCDPKPTDPVDSAHNFSAYHFKILSQDSSCVLLNGRLYEAGSVFEGSQLFKMSLPINQTLTDLDFTFDTASYWDSMTIVWQEADFQVERGQSYFFEFTEQTQSCTQQGDGETTMDDEPEDLPCETDDCCDVAGDANNDGVFSILDLTYLVDYFIRETVPPPDCLGEGDANGDCSFDEDGDLNYMIASIFTGGPDPICPSP